MNQVFVVNHCHSWMSYDIHVGWTHFSTSRQVNGVAYESLRDAERAMMEDIASVRRHYGDGGYEDNKTVRFLMTGPKSTRMERSGDIDNGGISVKITEDGPIDVFTGATLMPIGEDGERFSWSIDILSIRGKEM